VLQGSKDLLARKVLPEVLGLVELLDYRESTGQRAQLGRVVGQREPREFKAQQELLEIKARLAQVDILALMVQLELQEQQA
jgi:predicted GNAT family N-acyltransferase